MGNTYNDEETEIDLIELLLVLRHRLWAIIGAMAAGLAIMAAYTLLLVTPLYEAKSMVYILTTSTSITSLADIQVGTQLTTDYVILMKTHPVIDTVIENLQLDMTYEQLVEKVNINNPSGSRILEIRVTDPVPETAQKIANEMAAVTVAQMAEVMKTEEPSIAEEAQLPKKPVSPSLPKNCAIGALIGFVLAAGIVTVIYLLNDKIMSDEDIEKYLGLTTLGIIPDQGDSKNGKSSKTKVKSAKKLSGKKVSGGKS